MSSPYRSCAAVIAALLLTGQFARATTPPRTGEWPASYWEYVAAGRGATTTRSLVPMVRRVQANANAVRTGVMTVEAARAAGGTAIAGTRRIPILMVKYQNTGADPYPPANLQTELFGAFPTGTMTDYYREVSGGRLTVTGDVLPWKTISRNDTFYEGNAGCNGICNGSRISDFLTEALTANDASLNFGDFDNDGPDGLPNSGDDDGFVDFVAFVQPEIGGECQSNNNIWSHRAALTSWGVSEFTTNDARSGGGSIRVNDYVVMPARACDGSTMIQIGVFCHEFGHAFGLPDLYDTDSSNGDSEGVGAWCLMASGSWGGDGSSPERPTHMSAWAKQFLGWLTPTDVTADRLAQAIASMEDNPVAFRVPITANEHYLVSYRNKILFDSKLPSAGLLVLKINEAVVNAGLATNRVNGDAANKGVGVIEADGQNQMDRGPNQGGNRGDAGDPFPGSTNKRTFDNASTPRSQGSVAICNIGNPGATISADLKVSSGACSTTTPPDQRCSALTLSRDGGSGTVGFGWLFLLLPAAAAVFFALRGLRRANPIRAA